MSSVISECFCVDELEAPKYFEKKDLFCEDGDSAILRVELLSGLVRLTLVGLDRVGGGAGENNGLETLSE